MNKIQKEFTEPTYVNPNVRFVKNGNIRFAADIAVSAI